MQGEQVRSLVRELRSHKPRGVAKKKRKKNKDCHFLMSLFFFFLILFIYLFYFIYGCVGSSFLCEGFL